MKTYPLIPAETEKVEKIVLDAAFKVHTALGPGPLESVYQLTHGYEIRKSGLEVATQVAPPITYEVQLMTYLCLTGVRLGFLINFNVPHLSIKRMVV